MLFIVLLCVTCILNDASWSGYGSFNHKIPLVADGCKGFINNSSYIRPKLSLENIRKWKLWPLMASSHEMLHGETLCFFEAAMELIWENQHPADCSKGTFFLHLFYGL